MSTILKAVLLTAISSAHDWANDTDHYLNPKMQYEVEDGTKKELGSDLIPNDLDGDKYVKKSEYWDTANSDTKEPCKCYKIDIGDASPAAK